MIVYNKFTPKILQHIQVLNKIFHWGSVKDYARTTLTTLHYKFDVHCHYATKKYPLERGVVYVALHWVVLMMATLTLHMNTSMWRPSHVKILLMW
jgi:hypothetical protein